MVEKEILCFRDGLLAKLGLSLLVELLSDLLQVLFAQVSPSPGKGDTKKKKISYIYFGNYVKNFKLSGFYTSLYQKFLVGGWI